MNKKENKVTAVQGRVTTKSIKEIPHKPVYNDNYVSFIVDRDVDVVNDLTNYLIENGFKFTGSHYIEEDGVKKLKLDTDCQEMCYTWDMFCKED